MQRRNLKMRNVLLTFLVATVGSSFGQPFYPLYSGRSVTELTDWQFGFVSNFGDVLRNVDTSQIVTSQRVTVPSAFDVAAPGVLGRRGTGFYRTSITHVGRSRLQFAACSFFCRVWVDGAEVGSHRAGGYAPFWADIPPAQTAKARELLVLVDNRFNSTTAPVHTGGDFYEYGGLTRSVVLHALGSGAFVHGVRVLPLNTTAVAVTVSVRGGTAQMAELVSISFDAHNVSANMHVAGDGGEATAELTVVGARPWSLDAPHLHTVTVRVVSSGDGATARFGLRTLGVSASGRLTINGEVVKLRGVNRHTLSPSSGSALSLAEVSRDVSLLLELGANYVRGAHYPQVRATAATAPARRPPRVPRCSSDPRAILRPGAAGSAIPRLVRRSRDCHLGGDPRPAGEDALGRLGSHARGAGTAHAARACGVDAPARAILPQ